MVDEEKTKSFGDTSDTDKTVLQSDQSAKTEFQPYLIVAEGPHQGLKIPLTDGDNVIGRLMGCEVLLEDHSVSRKHAVLSKLPEGWTVEDLGSKNGTLVNNQKIKEKVMIAHRDIIRVGIYSLRLITKPVSKEEEAGPLPSDWEGKTEMFGKPSEDETATQFGESVDVEEKKEGPEAEEAAGEEKEEEAEEAPKEGDKPEIKKRPFWYNLVMLLVLLGIVVGGGSYAYFKFFAKPKEPSEKELKKPVERAPEPVPEKKEPGKETPVPVEGGVAPPVPAPEPEKSKEPLPSTVPVFLDFASSPLPAAVTFEGQSYGQTPVKIQSKLDVDKSYKAEGEFDLSEIGEKYKGEVTFTVKRDQSLIPILFKGPIGVLKVMELPRDVELYLEGYFVYNPFNAKTAKIDNVVFGKPLYVPYGKYVVELRASKELAGSGSFVKDIRYKREILVTEDSPIFVLKVKEEDLTEFPVEILSIPTNADVFVDGKKVGRTPYKGVFPLGEHSLSLRKDGYFEYKQDLKMDMNIPFKTEIELRTTVAGEFVNTGKHLIQKGQYKEAIAKLTEAFKQNPTPGETAEARYFIGSSFLHLGNMETAESYFQQALENEDMKHAAQLGLVSVYNGTGRKEEAIPHLVDVLLNAIDDSVKEDARRLFALISPLKSIMYVKTEPDGARVYLNDKALEQMTPLIVPDLPLGNYRLHIEKDGYMPQDLSINMAVNEFNPVIVNLKEIPE